MYPPPTKSCNGSLLSEPLLACAVPCSSEGDDGVHGMLGISAIWKRPDTVDCGAGADRAESGGISSETWKRPDWTVLISGLASLESGAGLIGARFAIQMTMTGFSIERHLKKWTLHSAQCQVFLTEQRYLRWIFNALSKF